MNQKYLLAIAFVGVLILFAGGVWLYQQMTGTESGSGTSSGSNFFGTLFPFGDTIVDIIGGEDTETPLANGPVPALRRVSAEVVAGATFADGKQGMVIRYVEKNTGHIYETPVDALTSTRLTNTTVPAVLDAAWTSASTTLLRFLAEDETPENFAAFFTDYTPDQTLNGGFLENFNRFALGAGRTLLTVTETGSGSTISTVLDDGTKKQTLLSSPIRSWIPLAGGNSYFVVSAPSSGVFGSIYQVTSGSLQKVGPSIRGLTALVSASGRYILLSEGSGTVVSLAVYDRNNGSTIVLPRGTFADKCAWVPGQEPLLLCAVPLGLSDGAYPDDWLLGRVHTEDSLWYVDPVKNTVTAVEILSSEGISFDVSNLELSRDGRYALFKNRNDGTLWQALLTPYR